MTDKNRHFIEEIQIINEHRRKCSTFTNPGKINWNNYIILHLPHWQKLTRLIISRVAKDVGKMDAFIH